MICPNNIDYNRKLDKESDTKRRNNRKFRTNFTESQSLILEECFQQSHYPDISSKKRLAMLLRIPEDRITVWFQNRRAKWRRKELNEKQKKYCEESMKNIASQGCNASMIIELEIKWNDSLFCLDEDDDHVGIAELAETVAIK
ncbi:unnamed protein product [Dracunculus medinensis]|uniref:Homeobox domain-containing protein n=1 Tax=Dracunculus medinensis TaxID=318479 RepID=A0A0N4U3W5_DRAME|nr:unnamed protein product [Dracunculus medinensis]